jgi:hypothetical protein
MRALFPVLGLISTMGVTGCRTLRPEAERVALLDRPPTNCKYLGVVNVDWTGWGTSTEGLNVMRNQTADLGGNALYAQSAALGTAYLCTEVMAK